MSQLPHEYQAEIGSWARRNFGHGQLPVKTLGLCEEAGEVARCVVKDAQRIRGTHEEWMKLLGEELADVMIKCFDVADYVGVDLWLEFHTRWKVVSQRDFRANPQAHGLPEDD